MTSIHRLATGRPSSVNSPLRRTPHPRSLLYERLQHRTDDERSRGHYLGVPSRESATVSRETDLLSAFNWKQVVGALQTQHHTESRQTAYDNSMRGSHRWFGWLCCSGRPVSLPSGRRFPKQTLTAASFPIVDRTTAPKCTDSSSQRRGYDAIATFRSRFHVKPAHHRLFSWPAEQQILPRLNELSDLRSKTATPSRPMPHPVSCETVPK